MISNQKKILIFTELLQSTGLGHFSRCSVLYDTFKEAGEAPFFIVHSDKEEKFPLDYQVLKGNWKDSSILEPILSEYKPDLSVVDSYLASEIIYKQIFEYSRKLICIDDNLRVDYPKDSIILNPGLYGKKLPYSRDRNLVLTGGEYSLLRKPFRRTFPSKQILDEVANILITTGGSDIKNITPSLIREVIRTNQTAKKNIIIGPGFTNQKEIELEIDSNCECFYSPNAEKMCEIMNNADLAITAGGQTTYELAKVGVPMIIFESAENQRGNIECFIEANAGFNLGKPSDQGFIQKLNECLCASKEMRKARSESARNLAEGLNKERVIQLLNFANE